MKSDDQYFPERFVKNRKRVNKAIGLFWNADFDNDADSYHELRSYVRDPVEEWHEGAYLPDEVLEERDEILARLDAEDYQLPENPSKEDTEIWAKHQSKKMDTQAWKEWSEWLAKTRKLIKNYPRLEEETSTSKAIIEFHRNGRNIFSLSPFLITLLNKTDVGNVRFEDVKLPYNSIYLHFGSLESIELPVDHIEHKHDIPYQLQDLDKRYYLDGAFVTRNKDFSLEIQLTFIDDKDNFNERIGIINDFRFPMVKFTLDFNEWDQENQSLKMIDGATFDNSTICFYDTWDPEGDASEIKYSEMHELLKKPDDFEYESEFQEYDLFDRSLSLIVNSLCYLNYVDNDVEVLTTPPQTTELLKALQQTNKKREHQKLKEKLAKHSYSKIHYFGSKVESEYRVTATGIELESHWRRGHWRNQPFGQELQKRKLIWIKPTIVRKDKGNTKTGHVYDV
uniref:hypothetical protein n=1 Tax=Microscilla sp. PRE1 TaxID=155537 RepID=UPI00146E6659|nr:hypothetical protein [Microscilla sp. PRE1]